MPAPGGVGIRSAPQGSMGVTRVGAGPVTGEFAVR